LKIPYGIVSEVVIDVREKGHWRDRREQQDSAVGRSVFDRLDAEASGRTRLVLDDDRPVEPRAHRIGDHSCGCVANAAGGIRDNDPDRGFAGLCVAGTAHHQAERCRECNSDHAHGRLAL
jgi:hypothetical protein